MTTPDESIELRSLVMDNASLNRLYDEHGHSTCHICKCPILMHSFGLGCHEMKSACRNPKCEVK